MSAETMINVLNTIRANSSPTYQERVPQATQENLTAVGAPLLEYNATMNEFLTSLVNRIGLTIVRNRELHNPLSVLKQGDMPLGKDIEEIWTNPAKAETYNPKSTDLLKQTPPDTKTLFHRMNRQDKYVVTISNPQLRTAFTSWENLEQLLNSIVTSLYSGNYLDEFLLAKRLLGSAVNDNKCIKCNIPVVADETSAKEFITAARLYHRNLTFPSAKNNAYSLSGGNGDVITWTPENDIRFIIRSDIEAFTDVNVLANAFNMDKTTFLGQTLIIDNFEGNDNCVAMMFDKAYTQIYDNYREMTEFFNGDTLTWNYYYHVWQTYSVSTLCNAVAFVTG
jgi:hypothetical protein|nr:MAG TPA: Head protein [Caudoviricetes sp.]